MSGIVRGLFGKKSKAEGILQKFSPAGFGSGGLTGTFSGNRFTVQRTAAAQGVLNDIMGASRSAASGFAGLRAQVTPGFGRLTDSRVNALRANRGRTVSNLREDLARRRVGGSSFAAREVSRVENEFALAEDQIRAESFLQEMDTTVGLIGQELAASLQGFEAVLSQTNFESQIAAQLSGLSSQLMQSTTVAMAEARAAQEAGAAEFLGSLIGAFAPTGKKSNPSSFGGV